MGKFKTTRAAIHAVNQAKTPMELRWALHKHYPEAFIDWDAVACYVGDVVTRKQGTKTLKYLVVKTANNEAALCYLGTSTLWKNFSTTKVGAFDVVSKRAFSEMTNGMKIESFKIEKKKPLTT